MYRSRKSAPVLSCPCPGQRNTQGKNGAAFTAIFDPDISAVGFHNETTKCQPQAASTSFLLTGRKLFEQTTFYFLRNARSAILNGYDHLLLVGVVAGADLYHRAFCREFHCIVQQVLENTLH